MGPDTRPLQVAPDVQMGEKRAPGRVDVEHDMGEAEDVVATLGDHRVLAVSRRSKATRPDVESVGNDVTVEVGVEVRPAIVTPPAVGMKGGDFSGIVLRRWSIAHHTSRSVLVLVGVRHRRLLIDPGIGTVPKPAAGPSTGQVPQVTLDEQRHDIAPRVVHSSYAYWAGSSAPGPSPTVGVCVGSRPGVCCSIDLCPISTRIDDRIPVSQSPTSSHARAIPMNSEAMRTYPIVSTAVRECALAMSEMPLASSNPKASRRRTIR